MGVTAIRGRERSSGRSRTFRDRKNRRMRARRATRRLQDSDPDPLHFIERDLVAGAAVEVGRVGQFVDMPHSRPIQSA